MTRRAEFLAANRGQRVPMPGFVLLVRDRRDGDPTPRLGITITKKVGGAVIRNRMRRRFREIARPLLRERGITGADHVLIGREGGIERDFTLLDAELRKALDKAAARMKPAAAGERAQARPVDGAASSAQAGTSAPASEPAPARGTPPEPGP